MRETYLKAEAHSELSQTSQIELCVKVVNSLNLLITSAKNLTLKDEPF